MIHNLSTQSSIANQFIAELRDIEVQKDSLRFRRNLERIGEILAYEISKTLSYKTRNIETPLGVSSIELIDSNIVLSTILRAGLPMHNGFLNYFDKAENAFVSAYRRHHKDGTFEINLQYVTSPDLTDSVLILCDPMLATGASMELTIKELYKIGVPKTTHIAVAIASQYGIDYMQRKFPEMEIWVGAIDEELTAKSYIVPGLGDAGDLCYGPKIQD